MIPVNPSWPPLLVVGGPTAAGKSALALELAKRFGGIIIAADSRQIYRSFDIGTAKPSQADRACVPHEMIDVVDPTERYTAKHYQVGARLAIAAAHAKGKLPILVGGTGFYIRAVLGGIPLPEVAPDPQRRAWLMAQADVWERLHKVDPETALRLHRHDRFRLARAIEVFEGTGRSLSSFKANRAPFRVAYLVLTTNMIDLTERIAQRTDQMLAHGWQDEVAGIITRFGENLPLLSTLGYRELVAERRGDLTLFEAREAILRATRKYARRQLTWFRGESAATWLAHQEGLPLNTASNEVARLIG